MVTQLRYHLKVFVILPSTYPKNYHPTSNQRLILSLFQLIPSLWKHDTRPVQFTLVVDNFGVKYFDEEHANHLKWVLEEHYTLTCDWTGARYIGITLDWNYAKHQVHLSMPKYVTNALNQFQHNAKKCQYAPYPCVPIQYGTKKQYAMQESKAPLLNNKAKRFIQQVCGKFLFLGRAVDRLSFVQSMPSHPNHPNQRSIQCDKPFNSSIT